MSDDPIADEVREATALAVGVLTAMLEHWSEGGVDHEMLRELEQETSDELLFFGMTQVALLTLQALSAFDPGGRSPEEWLKLIALSVEMAGARGTGGFGVVGVAVAHRSTPTGG